MKITRESFKNIVRETMIEENEYQEFFKKALEKTGKSIPDMSDEEKKDFFNKIDSAWQGRGEKKNEGNAFGAAVSDAKEKGEDEFEVGGEKFKVEEASTSSAPGEWVAYLSMTRGKKLLKTFNTARGAKQFLSKNVDKLLGGSNVESVGIMTKKQWDVGEAKYAIESANEASSKEKEIYSKIEKLRVLSNSGKITGDEFLDKFFPLWKQLKGMKESVITEQLVPVDKKAVDAFFNKKDFEGKNLNSDGKVLKTVGVGSQQMYIHTPKGVKMVGKVTGQYAQSLVQYVNKNHKSDLVEASVNELKKLPSGNFSIKVGYPTFADYEKKAKVGDTILKYDKRGGMIKSFVKGSELDKNAEKYLDKVNNITSGVVYLSKKGMKGVAQVPDYEKKEVGVLVLESKSINEEKYTVIDPKGNSLGTAEKNQVVMAAKKKGGEKTGHFVVSAKNALKARRALEKFKGDFKNPKLKDMMASLYESVKK